MDFALPSYSSGDDGDVVTGGEFHKRAFNDEKYCSSDAPLPRPLAVASAMDFALHSYSTDGDGDVVTGGEFHKRTFKDEEYCSSDAPLPPPLDSAGGDEADKKARSRTRRARIVLALGVVLEVGATLWAFQQAVSAGALDGHVDCDHRSLPYTLQLSAEVTASCDGPLDADVFNEYRDGLPGGSYLKEYVACDTLTDAAVTGTHDFEDSCTCSSGLEFSLSDACSWFALSSSSEDTCIALPFHRFTNEDGENVTVPVSTYKECWASNPSSTVDLTIAALAIALSSQLLEALVGFKYWKGVEHRTGISPELAVSGFEALGVFTVSAVLLSLPGLYTVSDYTTTRMPAFFWSAWVVVGIVVAGALAEIAAECFNRAAGRLGYLGAVGNGLIWLGAASIEVVVTGYLLWTGAGIRNVFDLIREAAGFLILELLGLVAMWAAHFMWARARVLRVSAKRLERPLHTGTKSRPSKLRLTCEEQMDTP